MNPTPTAIVRERELRDLRARYAALDSPLTCTPGTLWGPGRSWDVDSDAFRADNAYLWQTRHGFAGPDPAATYRAIAEHLHRNDHRGLLRHLDEDGAFGAVTTDHPRHGPLSRDRLDSVAELDFLDRIWDLFDRGPLTVLDIGAGYGRLAHRAVQARVPLHRYLCVDAVPESTHLCRRYLRHRRVDHTAVTVDLDQLQDALPDRVDLAVNVRSFTELPATVVTAWLDVLDRVQADALFLVPSHGSRIAALDADGTRPDLTSTLRARGWRVTADEPMLTDPDLHARAGRGDHHLLLTRA
ncbi:MULTISPECIES: putative sugar O-methyltransferase [Actinosynnema]|uniref:putative sugar O-methyltransferase n=1 Tax=Actinosynnema TaxID=40566 RepID=UPI0020A613F4|nr:putative sugar O-methyltransferase [Actinosynnema pretiosum]MCP2095567.1 putative sugar O-methyltransferase [Actinosynnema pretiosum]